ncbi:RNA-binding transcriptional accessory protein [Thiomicrospira microaerophila]|uniref:Tex family protein n=1 Tax=Thiomicrospira microaerophila TaxID=406020 RepID=UPI0020107A0F|nr:Tex family protein [Thiomicrospira microaerophila]UQB43195.1 RNA-binding transcriptional accessory protein [Thiomicrospira microaerophila]
MKTVDFSGMIANELGVNPSQVAAAIKLLAEGATVPFIARYRKEVTQGLDDIQLRQLEIRLAYLTSLQDRKQTILASIASQQKLTPELEDQIATCQSKTELEDLYRPFKPVRNSKATKAREAGLEPLAMALLSNPALNPEHEAKAYLNLDKGIETLEQAISGAQDILVEHLSQEPGLVAQLRETLWKQGELTSLKLKEVQDEGEKFKDYYDYAELISKIPSHRALALFRGEQTGVLRLKLDIPNAEPGRHPFLETIRRYHKLDFTNQPTELFFTSIINQAWRLKLAKSLENELFSRLREQAEQGAIDVFAQNLKDLLLAAPAGAKVTLALDPGYRTGVKLAVVDTTGKLLATDTVYPHQPQNQWQATKQKLAKLIAHYQVELVSIGNGTASRETEQLVAETLKDFQLTNTQKVVVSEAGASVYSASELAQKEFPDLDVSIRGAVSIGRRLQDPLAELVKIDPKAIGVGQYQHDVNQTALAQSLQATVEDCVNSVGVDLNTASVALLSYVSGLSGRLAQAIVDWRDENGSFTNRKQLKQVPRLGPKAFEQSAGFLRIRNGDHPLDQSAVHPESYAIVEHMAKDLKLELNKLVGAPDQIQKIPLKDYVNELVGLPTLRDILSELEKPGRDPRPSIKTARFSETITEIKDLAPGLLLEGVVTNVTHFGAFVDIGVHQDGLVHISHLADKFVSDPRDVVKAGQIVQVTVLEVDAPRKRISLSMKSDAMVSGVAAAQQADRKTINAARSSSNQSAKTSTSLGTLADKFAALKR